MTKATTNGSLEPVDDTTDLWIHIQNWDQFQHYHDRDPSWIKLYLELQDKDEWLELTYAERGLLVTIWIAYARAKGRLRLRQVRAKGAPKSSLRHFQDHITSLNHAGLIELTSSKPLALRGRQRRELPSEVPKSALAAAHAAPPLQARAEEEEAAPASEPYYPGEAAAARQLYDPEEPERDPEALERIRELAERMGVRRMPGSQEAWRGGVVRADGSSNGANPHGEPSVD